MGEFEGVRCAELTRSRHNCPAMWTWNDGLRRIIRSVRFVRLVLRSSWASHGRSPALRAGRPAGIPPERLLRALLLQAFPAWRLPPSGFDMRKKIETEHHRVVRLRVKLLPSLSTGRAPRVAGRYIGKPCRVSMYLERQANSVAK
jgi:hypothetical protein